jgi:uncharacterized Rmd1/YagE family protein
MAVSLLNDETAVMVRALLVAERIDTKPLESGQAVATTPTTVILDGGAVAIVFRFGVVVFFGATSPEQRAFLTSLHSLTHGAYELPDSEEVLIQFEPSSQDTVAADKIILTDHSAERLQLLAEVLARSVLLARYESGVTAAFDRIEPIAATLKRTGRIGRNLRPLLQHVGEGLLSEQRLVGRATVVEKPDLLWDNANLERFYVRLIEEFDVNERYATLQHKQELISRTAQTVLDLLQTQRAFRVEIAVLSLIAIEIGLSLYDLFFRK